MDWIFAETGHQGRQVTTLCPDRVIERIFAPSVRIVVPATIGDYVEELSKRFQLGIPRTIVSEATVHEYYDWPPSPSLHK